MSESRHPHRIEIELTSHESAPEWARTPNADGGEAGKAERAERGSVVKAHAVGVGGTSGRVWGSVAVALAALALGWLLGRSSGSSDDPTVGTASTTIASAMTAEPPDVMIAAVDPTIASSPTAPIVETEMDPPTSETASIEQVEVHQSIAGAPVEIVALGTGRRVITLDLATGTLVTRAVDSQPFGPPTLFVGPGLILLPSFDADAPSTLLRVGSDPERVDVGTARELVGVPGSDTLWRLTALQSGPDVDPAGRVRAEQITFDGNSLGVVVELPVAPLGADPRGGLLVQVPGGAYAVRVDGASQITSGRLVAIGADLALGYECDSGLVCGYVLIDRTTAARTAVSLDPALGDPAPIQLPWAAALGSGFSPDGTSVVVETTRVGDGTATKLLVLDLESGLATEVSPITGTQYAWSPDGRALFHMYGGRLMVFDLESGESNPVVSDFLAIETFAVRPPAAG